jgi:hypothetical protein
MDWKQIAKSASSSPAFKDDLKTIPKSANEVLQASIDKQLILVADPKKEGKRWFTIKGESAKLTIRYANKPLKLLGDETAIVVPVKSLKQVFEGIKADVIKGDFNAQLEAAEKVVKARTTKMAATRRSNKGEKSAK